MSKTNELEDHLELAWGIIANAYGGNWDLAENKEWKPAAERWRDNYNKIIRESTNAST